MSTVSKARRKSAKARKTNRTGLRLTAGSVLVALLLVALGWFVWRSQRVTRDQAPVAESAAADDIPGPGDGPPASDFTVPTLHGGTFTLSAQRGKPVILFIMAYWCGTCVPEAQALAELHQKYGHQVSIIALDVDPSSTPEALQQFREWVGEPDYVWAFDQDNRVVQAYQIRALDTTIIINQAGEIIYTDSYPTPFQTLEEQIKKLLG